MGTFERREREKAELRQKIMDAAREMFVVEGAEAVTMRKIAARIEYSATAIYAYFPDKEALLRALCQHDFSQFLQAGMHVLQEPEPTERILQAVRFYIDFAIEHPHQYQFMFMLQVGVEPSDPALVAYALMRDTVGQLAESGRLRSECQDVDLIAHALWAAVHGAAALHIAGKLHHPHERAMRDIALAAVSSMLRGFLREEPVSLKKTAGKALRQTAKLECPVRRRKAT
jgi:AcrR family transcriptional regulator